MTYCSVIASYIGCLNSTPTSSMISSAASSKEIDCPNLSVKVLPSYSRRPVLYTDFITRSNISNCSTVKSSRILIGLSLSKIFFIHCGISSIPFSVASIGLSSYAKFFQSKGIGFPSYPTGSLPSVFVNPT